MSIRNEKELIGMKRASDVVAVTLRDMRNFARPGMSTKQLDDFGRSMLDDRNARPAPKLTYGFPGCTCISVNHEIAHGIPSERKILREGDLVNIDVSAELKGFWSDNGCSFVLGKDIRHHQPLVDASRQILRTAIGNIREGIRISAIGHLMDTEAKKRGYKVIRNLTGHGIGRSLHEEPAEIANYRDVRNVGRLKKNMVVAIETFISTISTHARVGEDGWTLLGNRGGFVAQHEHTIVIRNGEPLILTEMNEIWS